MANCPILIDPEEVGLTNSRRILSAAAQRGLYADEDLHGNILVRIPQTKPGPVILLHGYSSVAAAFMIALINSPDCIAPERELVFSVYDEKHHSSLWDFDMSRLRAHLIINLDAKAERKMISSCVGFARLRFTTDLERVSVPQGRIPAEVRIFGLRGGSSTEDIHEGRLNAVKAMGEFLFDWYNYSIDTLLVSVWGGEPTNTIPKECTARIWIHQEQRENLDRGAWWFGEDLAKRYAGTDPEARIEIRYPESVNMANGWEPVSADDTGRILSFLNLCPNGMINRNPEEDDRVETSCNVRKVKTEPLKWTLYVTVRSFDDEQKDALRDKYELLAEMNRIDLYSTGDFPSWKHTNVSDLQRRYQTCYEAMWKEQMKVVSIGEEQECMLFLRSISDAQTISIGVDHQDGKPLQESVERTWQTLLRLLEG